MIPPNPNDLHTTGASNRKGSNGVPAGGSATHPAGVYLPVPLAAPESKPVLPPALSLGITPQSLLKALRKRWARALLLGILLAAAVGVGVYYFLPSAKFTGRTVLHVHTEQPFLIFQGVNRNDPNFNRTQMAMVRSRLVLMTALKDPKVAALQSVREQLEPITWLTEQIKVDYSAGPDFLTITMNGDNEAEINAILNAVTEAYLSEVVYKEHNKRLARIDQLKDIAQNYQNRIDNQKNSLRELQKAAGADRKLMALQQELFIKHKGAAQSDLIRLQTSTRAEKIELQMLRATEQSLDKAQVPENVLTEYFARDPHVQEQEKKIAEIKDQIAKMAKVVRPEQLEEAAKSLRADIKKTQDGTEAYKLKNRPKATQEMRARLLEETQTKINALETKLAFSAQFEKELLADIERYTRLQQDFNAQGLNMDAIQDQIQHAETISKNALADAAKMEVERVSPPRVQRLGDQVEMQRLEMKTKNLRTAGMAAVAALVLVFLAVSWWEWRARRIDTVDEVVHGLGMTVFGALPAWRRETRRLTSAKTGYRDMHWQSLFTESVDATRTLLLHAARQEALRVVLVTSAVSGEGKTSLSTHLATSLARANRRTLLLDCDLRNPAAHRLFDLPNIPGFSEVLRGEVSFAEAVRPTTVNGLWLLSAGQVDDRVLQLLAGDDLGNVFAQLKEQYEFIVVDSSPVLPVADSLLVAQQVDAVLFSILRDVSRIPMVYTAYQRLAALGVRMLGAVVNGAREEAHAYSGGYGYSYGYGAPPSGAEAEEGSSSDSTATAN